MPLTLAEGLLEDLERELRESADRRDRDHRRRLGRHPWRPTQAQWARVATLDELGLDVLEWRAAAVEELELLRDIARALADEAIGGRQAREHAAAWVVGDASLARQVHLRRAPRPTFAPSSAISGTRSSILEAAR